MGRNYEQLSLDDRCEIAHLQANGRSIRRQRSWRANNRVVRDDLEHVPPRLNRRIPLGPGMSDSIGIDSLLGAG